MKSNNRFHTTKTIPNKSKNSQKHPFPHVRILGGGLLVFLIFVWTSLHCFSGADFDSASLTSSILFEGEFIIEVNTDYGAWDQVRIDVSGVVGADETQLILTGPMGENGETIDKIFTPVDDCFILYGLVEGSYTFIIQATKEGLEPITTQGEFTLKNCNTGTFAVETDITYGEWNDALLSWTGLREDVDTVQLILSGANTDYKMDIESPIILEDLNSGLTSFVLVAKKLGCPDNYTTGTFTIIDCDLGAFIDSIDLNVGAWDDVQISWEGVSDESTVSLLLEGETERTLTDISSPITLEDLNPGNHTYSLIAQKAGCEELVASNSFEMDPCALGTLNSSVDVNYGTFDEIELTWDGVLGQERFDVVLDDGGTPTTFSDVSSPFTTSGLAEATYSYEISAHKTDCSAITSTGNFEISVCNMGTLETLAYPFSGYDSTRIEWSGITGQDQFDLIITDTTGTPTTYTDVSSPYELTSLDEGEYTYEIQAIKAGCDTISKTNDFSISTCNIGTIVSSATPLPGGESVRIEWSGINGEDQFDVYIIGPSNKANFNVTSPLDFFNLAGGDYTYRIDAKKTGCPVLQDTGNFTIDSCDIGTLNNVVMDENYGYWDQGQLTWDGIVGADQIDLVLTGDVTTTFEDISSPFTFTAWQAGTITWEVRVIEDGCPTQTESDTITITEPDCPEDTVPNVSASDDRCSGVWVDWDTVDFATEYHIYRSTDSAGVSPAYTKIGTIAAPPYQDDTTVDGTAYFYKITGASAPCYNETPISDFEEGFRYTPAFTETFESEMPTDNWSYFTNNGTNNWYRSNHNGQIACHSSGCNTGQNCSAAYGSYGVRAGSLSSGNTYSKLRRTIYKPVSAESSSLSFNVARGGGASNWSNAAVFHALLNKADDILPCPGNDGAYTAAPQWFTGGGCMNYIAEGLKTMNLTSYSGEITIDFTYSRCGITYSGWMWVDNVSYTPPSDCN